MFKKNKNPADYEQLFLKEEFKGDRLINNLRFFLLMLFVGLVLAKAWNGSRFEISLSFNVTMSILGVAALYTVVLFFLYRNEIYTPLIKYFSMSIDICLILLSIFVYKLDRYEDYGMIFFLARFSIMFIFITLSVLRYNFMLSLYAGLIAGIGYIFLVILNNDMLGLQFSFMGNDGNSHSSFFSPNEVWFRVVYLICAGIAAAFAAYRFKNFIISNLQREAEKSKLEVKNKLIESRDYENRKYLDNIREGLLLLDSSFIIGEQYSKSLGKLFPGYRIAGESFIDFIYKDDEAHAEERYDLEKFLSVVLNNLNADMDMITEINPIRQMALQVKNEHGAMEEKTLQINFKRIMKDEQVENIMVILEDKTYFTKAQAELEKERSIRESEIGYIEKILKAGPQSFLDFINEAEGIIDSIEQILPRLEEKAILADIFRLMHSLKGTSKAFGFEIITRLCHRFEDNIDNIRSGKTPFNYDILLQLETMIESIAEEFKRISSLTEQFKEFSAIEISSREDQKQNSYSNFLAMLEEMTANISEELNKEVTINIDSKVDELPFLDKVRNPIIHLVRNSIDHGLEETIERLGKNKSSGGRINVKIYREEDFYYIEIEDDGRGIDFEAIKKKAMEKNMITKENVDITDQRLLKLLFAPGFSSRDNVTDISGRGVGLDIVKYAIDDLGGKIGVKTKKDLMTRFTLKVPADSVEE